MLVGDKFIQTNNPSIVYTLSKMEGLDMWALVYDIKINGERHRGQWQSVYLAETPEEAMSGCEWVKIS